MKAWIVARRLKRGQDAEFRRRWGKVAKPPGMKEAFLLEEAADAQEVLSLTLWDSPDALTQYRASEAARQRQDDLGDLVEHEDWSRVYDVTTPGGSGGGMRPVVFALPALLAATAGSLFVSNAVKRRNQSIVERSRQAAVAQTRQRSPWLLLPAALLPAGAGSFFLVRRLLGRGERETGQYQAPPSDEDRPLQTLEATVAAERRESDAGVVPGRPAVSRPTGRPGEKQQPMTSSTPAAQSASVPEATTSGAGTAPRSGARLSDAMTTAPEALEYDAFVTIAEARMRELGVDALPVVADGQLAGIVTRGDLANSLVDGEPPPEHDRVVDYMSEVPVTIAADASVEEATRLMADHKIHHLVIVDGTRPVGVFSRGQTNGDGESPASDGSAAGSAQRIVIEPAPDSGR